MCLTIGVIILASTEEIQLVLYSQFTVGTPVSFRQICAPNHVQVQLSVRVLNGLLD